MTHISPMLVGVASRKTSVMRGPWRLAPAD